MLVVLCNSYITNAEWEAEALALERIPKLFLQVATECTTLAEVFLPIDPFVVDAAFFERTDTNDAGW